MEPENHKSTDRGMWYQSAVSGFWYENCLAAGDVGCIKMNGVLYRRVSENAIQADAKSCPLYVDYKKSCKALRDREEELNRTA